MKTRCIIVDDEPLAVEAIKMHVEKFDSLTLVASCTDAFQAFEVLNRTRVDLIFLDIQMPEITGLDFLKSIKHPPGVILTTAHREYALDAFDLNVVDYLLKPVSFERFMKAINKYFEQKGTELPVSAEHRISKDEGSGYFFVRSDKKNVKIKYEDVLYVESLKDYVRIVCRNRIVITKLQISDIQQKLPQELFLRIHRSFIVYLPNVEAFSGTHVDLPGKELPIGRNFKQEVLKTLSSL